MAEQQQDKPKKPIYKKWWFWGIVIIVIAAIGKQGGNKTQATSTSEPATTTEVTKAPETNKIGDVIKFDDSEWIVLSAVNNGSKVKSNNQFQKDAKSDGGLFFTVKFKVKNLSAKEERILETPKIKDEQGREFKQIDLASFYIPEDGKTMNFEPLPSGITKTYYAVYEVAGDAKTVYFESRSLSAFPDKKLVLLGNVK